MWSAEVSSTRKRKRADRIGDNMGIPEKVEEPETIKDLVTHSRKISEVRDLLAKRDKRAQMILLSGPTGSCKTVTLKAVARSLGFEIQEWVNPVDKIEFDDGVDVPFDPCFYREPSHKEKFEAFIFRSSRYKTLFSNDSKRIILIEDIPNYFIQDTSKFREFLCKYKEIGQCPIVFICTDDENLNLDHSLFPPDIRNAFSIENIKFNPIPQSVLLKTLKRFSPSLKKETLEAIARSANGDIRAALGSLKFSQSIVTNGESNNLTKDISTDFYKTLGRVLYPKRANESPNSGNEFLYDLKDISDNFNYNFFHMLHENYLNTFSDLKDTIRGSGVFSDGDIICSGDSELMSYLAFVTVAGLMCANKQPKKGTFRPMVRSRFSDLSRKNMQVTRLYPQFGATNRVLNLDIIPYLPVFPHMITVVSSFDADRFPSLATAKRSVPIPIFKVPLPVENSIDFDETNIEEFED